MLTLFVVSSFLLILVPLFVASIIKTGPNAKK